MTETPPPSIWSERSALLERFVQAQAARLRKGYEADRGSVVAELARLRRALPRGGITPPEAWEILARDFPEELRGGGDAPSTYELAATSALSFFALHQQSKRKQSMHRRDDKHRLGRAAHTLMLRNESDGVRRHMQALVRAGSFDAVLEHLRALVTQLRAAEIPLDYAQLAVDLQDVQHPGRIHRARERWSRDFHRPIPSTATDDPPVPTATTATTATTAGENDA
ncbi:type I-E CRISPR-associated protein Cse2/CasB [Nocardioides carbamazepini]|uniref:type I-E CRISPR-associated protein Cse2/CasB n=1 Tax=Nocardioides carbamazepini TaxID=2854259 RepID=UPI002149C42A|nr:type I-E CRISPR-associated protein Cse2/CasB [Nocardioides carbamazepini]MCR1781134.1 type I-E CRISPR-associated protein Cse2/CasB [Nocardioides carbamazepini]